MCKRNSFKGQNYYEIYHGAIGVILFFIIDSHCHYIVYVTEAFTQRYYMGKYRTLFQRRLKVERSPYGGTTIYISLTVNIKHHMHKAFDIHWKSNHFVERQNSFTRKVFCNMYTFSVAPGGQSVQERDSSRQALGHNGKSFVVGQLVRK